MVVASSDSLSSMPSRPVRKALCDNRTYRVNRLPNGVRLLLVSDPGITFAAVCANVRAGYFDDPDSVPGLAHFLEHAVHLGKGVSRVVD